MNQQMSRRSWLKGMLAGLAGLLAAQVLPATAPGAPAATMLRWPLPAYDDRFDL